MARLDTPRTLRDRLYKTFHTRAPASATGPGGAPRPTLTPEEALTMRSLIRVTLMALLMIVLLPLPGQAWERGAVTRFATLPASGPSRRHHRGLQGQRV